MKTSEYFVEFVKRSAELKGWTASELSREIGTSRQHVHWWYIGKNRMSIDMAQKCLDALKAEWSDFGKFLKMRRKRNEKERLS